jgi:uncharacterized membrane protein YgaE (UPF0421/DUF939 family)
MKSYLNGTLIQLTEASWGWDVAWRRFVTVSIGITVAFCFAYRKFRIRCVLIIVPPSYSARRSIRYSHSQVIAVVGTIFSDILSHANDQHSHLKEDVQILQKLLTWRTKLNKVSRPRCIAELQLGLRHNLATYEYSLRGRWPEDRYNVS